MENQRLLSLIICNSAFVHIIRHLLDIFRSFKVKLTVALERTDVYNRLCLRIFHFIHYEVLSVIFREELLNVKSIKVVVDVTTFPSYDIVSLLFGVIELNHKLKFESFAWISVDQFVWDLCNPLVTICPLHLHATSAAVFVWIPFAEVIWRSKQPQVLAKLRFIFYSQDEFLNIDVLRL